MTYTDLNMAGITHGLWGGDRQPLIEFVHTVGRMPIRVTGVGRWDMAEIITEDGERGFHVGCRRHSLVFWAKYFTRIAKRYRATTIEIETARVCVSTRRVFALD